MIFSAKHAKQENCGLLHSSKQHEWVIEVIYHRRQKTINKYNQRPHLPENPPYFIFYVTLWFLHNEENSIFFCFHFKHWNKPIGQKYCFHHKHNKALKDTIKGFPPSAAELWGVPRGPCAQQTMVISCNYTKSSGSQLNLTITVLFRRICSFLSFFFWGRKMAIDIKMLFGLAPRLSWGSADGFRAKISNQKMSLRDLRLILGRRWNKQHCILELNCVHVPKFPDHRCSFMCATKNPSMNISDLQHFKEETGEKCHQSCL